MWFRFLLLWFFCFKNGLDFDWAVSKRDPNYWYVTIINRKLQYIPTEYLSIYIRKKSCKRPYQIYNRIKRLINVKMIKKRRPITRKITDFGCYKLVTWC